MPSSTPFNSGPNHSAPSVMHASCDQSHHSQLRHNRPSFCAKSQSLSVPPTGYQNQLRENVDYSRDSCNQSNIILIIILITTLLLILPVASKYMMNQSTPLVRIRPTISSPKTNLIQMGISSYLGMKSNHDSMLPLAIDPLVIILNCTIRTAPTTPLIKQDLR